jgi:hypothetical protein
MINWLNPGLFTNISAPASICSVDFQIMNWEEFERKQSLSVLRRCSRICSKGLRKSQSIDILLPEGWTRTFQVWGRGEKHWARLLSTFWLRFISTHCICLYNVVLRHLQMSNLTKTVIWFLKVLMFQEKTVLILNPKLSVKCRCSRNSCHNCNIVPINLEVYLKAVAVSFCTYRRNSDFITLYWMFAVCLFEQSLIVFYMDTSRSWVDHLPQHGKHGMLSCIQID